MKDRCSYCEKYKAVYEPRNQCATCWDKYFNTHLGHYVAAKIGLEKLGRDAVTRSRGVRFLKQLERYIVSHNNPDFEEWFRKTYGEGQNPFVTEATGERPSDTEGAGTPDGQAEVSAG